MRIWPGKTETERGIMSGVVISVGATCFGVVLGYVTYRTLVRKSSAAISDIAAVGAAVGGGVVSQINHGSADSFGWYSIGLLIGFAVFLILRFLLERDDSKPLILGE
jgi:hypothetical protein